MKYCSKCLLPDTKPYITFDENGVCSACIAHEKKNTALQGIDWKQRRQQFGQLVAQAKARNAPYYDALVPVSGGKDSITQVHRLLDFDLRILAVNIDYGIKTEIGRQNLACIPAMGASLITYRPELNLHKKLIRLGFEDYGDPDLLSHTMLHGYPLRMALQFTIPLVLLGENSAFEYGGSQDIASGNSMTRQWFNKYAANADNNPAVISDKYNIPYEKLITYDFPDEIETSETKAVFMSYYFHWDSEKHLEIAKSHGFKALENNNEGTYRNYVGIDEKINRIHQYMKVLKFGYGRATDHACEDIRAGRITRDQGIELVKKYDTQRLSEYYKNDFCEFLGYAPERFDEIIDQSRNRDIVSYNDDGSLNITGHQNYEAVLC
jgi:N-acetyl sugar amidotransferase